MPSAYRLLSPLLSPLLNVADTRTLLVRMKVGPVAESVTVDASGLTLNSTDGAVSTVVDRKLAEAVPLNGRTFQDLISMTPGIVTQSPQAAGQRSQTQGDFSVNGMKSPQGRLEFSHDFILGDFQPSLRGCIVARFPSQDYGLG
jgi:hypothetical protein